MMNKEFVNAMLFVIKSYLIFFEYLILLFFRFNKFDTFKYSVKKLGDLNIFYVKIFQSLCTNVNLLDEEQINFLSKYTDNVPYTNDDVDITFLETINNVSNNKLIIENINNKTNLPEPYKSGMIALIYVGELDDKKIIVKVMKKNIKNKLNNDLNKIKFLIDIIKYLPYIKKLNLDISFNENKNNLLLQTDFKNEIKNMHKMIENFKNIDYIIVPTPFEKYTETNDNIIVMNYLEGNKITDICNKDKDNYAILLAKFGIKCLLYDRFVHSDLHSGNILFINDNDKLKLGILDFGVMDILSKEEQHAFYKFFLIFSSENDNKLLGNNILDDFTEPKEIVSNLSVFDNNILRERLGIAINNIFNKNKNITPKDMYYVNSILYDYNLRLSTTFCRIQISQVIGDSVGSNLNNKISYMENLKIVSKSMFSEMNLLSQN